MKLHPQHVKAMPSTYVHKQKSIHFSMKRLEGSKRNFRKVKNAWSTDLSPSQNERFKADSVGWRHLGILWNVLVEDVHQFSLESACWLLVLLQSPQTRVILSLRSSVDDTLRQHNPLSKK